MEESSQEIEVDFKKLKWSLECASEVLDVLRKKDLNCEDAIEVLLQIIISYFEVSKLSPEESKQFFSEYVDENMGKNLFIK